jgi:hypothetical protein
MDIGSRVEGEISITPIHLDLTAFKAQENFLDW